MLTAFQSSTAQIERLWRRTLQKYANLIVIKDKCVRSSRSVSLHHFSHLVELKINLKIIQQLAWRRSRVVFVNKTTGQPEDQLFCQKTVWTGTQSYVTFPNVKRCFCNEYFNCNEENWTIRTQEVPKIHFYIVICLSSTKYACSRISYRSYKCSESWWTTGFIHNKLN